MHSVVVSSIEFNSCATIVIHTINNEIWQGLELLGNSLELSTVARLICNVSRLDGITPSLYSLHWLPIIYSLV